MSLALKQTIFIFIYRFLFIPIAIGFVLPIAAIFNKKVRAGLRLRRQIKPKEALKNPVWLHCASGEFEYAKSVLRELKKLNPNQKILVTYFSPSYQKPIEMSPFVDRSEMLPLDLPGPIASFLDKYEPVVLLIARTDLWPEMLYQVKKRNIPALLFSHSKTEINKLSAAIDSLLYSMVTEVFAVSNDDQSNLKKLTRTPISVAGDTRFDQVSYRLKNPSKDSDALSSILHSNYFLAGSTWPDDEVILLDAYTRLTLTERPPLIIVPHESDSEHLLQLEGLIRSKNLTSERLSQALLAGSWDDKTILIVDRTGILADLYKGARASFVGGSFKSKIHSVMEPLGASSIVLVGPFYKNNREAIEFSNVKVNGDLTAVNIVRNAEEFAAILKKVLALEAWTEEAIKKKIETEFKIRTGATSKVLSWLDNKGALR